MMTDRELNEKLRRRMNTLRRMCWMPFFPIVMSRKDV